MNKRHWRRFCALFLAAAILITGIPFQSAAKENTVEMIIRGDAFQNRPINIFGHSHRSITCYYVNPVEGHVPAFCLQPGKKLPNHTVSSYTRYDAEPGASVPVIGSFDRYLPMTLAYEWMVSGNYYDKTRYAMVQTYLWGCLAGYEEAWDVQEEMMHKLESVIRDGKVLPFFHEMREYVENGLAEYENQGNSDLPEWNGRQQRMELKDGRYELTLDISSCPQLKNAVWQFPDGNWIYEIGADGTSVTFIYQGETPSGRISSGPLSGIKTRYYAYIFQPEEKYQMQMGWLDMADTDAEVWFEAGLSLDSQESPGLELYRRKEVFESNYKVQVEKYCAETGKPLEEAEFNVWETFDFGQVNEHGYEEGNPDGSTGEVYVNCMSPKPEERILCDVISTDENGTASHSDIRSYHYSKTYCMGHPAPEWVECDHEGEGEGDEAEDCSCEEENERLRSQWLAEQELCSRTCDFHVGNEDEDNHSQSTEAMEAMLEDRDETYENFIRLEYGYTAEEKKARNGYTIHGTHRDDPMIETVVLMSAQAESNVRQGEMEVSGEMGLPALKTYGESLEALGEERGYRCLLPEGEKIDLEELRSILEIREQERTEPAKKESAGETTGVQETQSASGQEQAGAQEPDKEGLESWPDSQQTGGEAGNKEEAGGQSGWNETEGEGAENPSEDEKMEGTEAGNPSDKQETGGEVNGNSPEGQESSRESSGNPSDKQDNVGEEAGNQSGGQEVGGEVSENPPDSQKTGGQEAGNQPGSQESGSVAEKRDPDIAEIAISPHLRSRLLSPFSSAPIHFLATSNDAQREEELPEKGEQEEGLLPEEEDMPVTEQFEYIKHPVAPFPLSEPEYTSAPREKIREDQKKHPFSLKALFSFLSEDEEEGDSLYAVLPDFIDDDLEPMDPSDYGDPLRCLYRFKIWDHRTEGRIHINKRDLELYKGNPEGSYGKTQGNATLEGAVYGLFAAQDIIHPDGKSGVVYGRDQLTAIAATDKEGNASFLAYTECPGTLWNGSGTEVSAFTGPENLYQGSQITSSDHGFGTKIYPDYKSENGSVWIGRPLLMGSYYVMELSRSEGYELSVQGLNKAETNREADESVTVISSGSAWVKNGLSDHNSMEADGSWNDFTIESYDAENGYDITITGYPEHTRFYRLSSEERRENVKQIVNTVPQQKVDEHGTPVYKKAAGGELKTDEHGNPILKEDSSEEEKLPLKETLPYRFRTAPYPFGTAEPEDLSLWDQPVEEDYLKEQAEAMLAQLGYHLTAEEMGAPWVNIPLKKENSFLDNSTAASQILDWYTEHGFYDCAGVGAVYEKEGEWFARLHYDHSGNIPPMSGIYDRADQRMYVKKEAEQGIYWLEYEKGTYSLKSRTVTLKEKRELEGEVLLEENTLDHAAVCCQPVYECYKEGEILLDVQGNPIPEMEQVPVYEEKEVVYQTLAKEPVEAVWDASAGSYTIHFIPKSVKGQNVQDVFRAVTDKKTIELHGTAIPYNQYLIHEMGAAVDVASSIIKQDPGSYIKPVLLSYPGQNQPVQDGETQKEPVQVLERAIKQSVRVSKDISQESYENVNTYGSVHNDPMTALLGLFGGSGRGTKLLDQFKFRLYLKSDLVNLYADEAGNLLSEDISSKDFTEAVQAHFLPPKDGGGQKLLEKKADGSWNYKKFFDALYAADQRLGTEAAEQKLTEFALSYVDVKAYKEEILKQQPDLNEDRAYRQALAQAKEEAKAYTERFKGLDEKLSIAWDRDPSGGADRDKKTLQCSTRNGKDDYFDTSIMLPYGEYVMVEQQPSAFEGELANRHYRIEEPKEITLPFVPEIVENEQTGEENVLDETGSSYFRYNSTDSAEELVRKYKIRFNGESHVIRANGQDGEFEVYKYGLDLNSRPGHSLTSSQPYEEEYMDGANPAVKAYYSGYTSESENKGIMDGVVYDGNETENGQVQIRDQVPVMEGEGTAIHGKFAPMLVPWTVLAPATDRVNPDTGSIETLYPSGSGADFNYVSFAQEDVENTYFSSRLRIEKMDAETGETIFHDGALFRIYAAKRDVKKTGTGTAGGSGQVLFGSAVDAEGKPVKDENGKQILYPRVGADNSSESDVPIRLDEDGIPLYDESQRISQLDENGIKKGIFRSYSTLKELVIDGRLCEVPVGYIETARPLGAGAYVLVEVQAPKGYTKSRPVAFEIYGDQVVYYEENTLKEGNGWERKTARQYEYAIPVTGEENRRGTEKVSEVPVQDYPSELWIYKTEDGDSLVGNGNGLKKTDAQGKEEASGGFTGNQEEIYVNDRGDLLLYKVSGRKEKLEARGDVREITFDQEKQIWTGYVTKAFDSYSEHVIEGTEQELKAMDRVKLLYELDGTFTGKGIRFDRPVSGAELVLYEGSCLEPKKNGGYEGVTVLSREGRTEKIVNTHTGTHRELLKSGTDLGPGKLDLWEDQKQPNEPIELYFYDLEKEKSQGRLREDIHTGELQVLDERGNVICFADKASGMAYVRDDYGRIIAYRADEKGEKIPVRSICVGENGGAPSIYKDKQSADDENGLPVYYKNGEPVWKEERWVTGESTGPDGKEEGMDEAHVIARLPFGAYILQEEGVPFEQGYVQAPYQGLILEDRKGLQKYFHQDEFTKAAFAKIDIRTQKEIKGAEMTLYRALLDKNGRPETEETGIYKKGEPWAAWISGYAYDDKGVMKKDSQGNPIPTDEPHWIDHIPVGFYVLEETLCPYDQGYVQSESVNVEIQETGHVQSFEMEDDFTAIEVWKLDGKRDEVLCGDTETGLTLYRALLDAEGRPVMEEGHPAIREDLAVFTFRAATWEDGQKVAATGRVETDAAGLHPIMKYDYQYNDIPGTFQGRYYYTENASVRMEYLPVGSYVLAETQTPEGYATADPILIEIPDKGHMVSVGQWSMKDEPLKLSVSKRVISGGKEVAGAELSIYPVSEDGRISSEALILHIPEKDGSCREEEARWISGNDGKYTQKEAEAGTIPEGFEEGDLKPHLIEYIPDGDYILREEMTPYGFLQSVDLPFSVIDSRVIQKLEMKDEIPDGVLQVIKHDGDDHELLLEGAEFELFNKTLGISCQKAVTDFRGRAVFEKQPAGYLASNGSFAPYTYVCREIKAAPGHMLSAPDFEFQFEYKDERTKILNVQHDPENDSNRVKVEKQLGDTGERLKGALLRLERKISAEDGGHTGKIRWETAAEWISGDQPHLEKGLKEGEYRLTEQKAPEGCNVLAEPVYFTIADGMKEALQLVMKNYTVIVQIAKTDRSSGAFLAGARLQLIRTDTGEVIEEWTSEEHTPKTFVGLKPGSYRIHEIYAPEGYERAEDMEIEIEDQSSEIQTFSFANTRITSSGGGGSHRPQKEYISFKKTDVNHLPVPGAEFTFYDQWENEMDRAVSDEKGYFSIPKPSDGTYTFRETKAPQGYGLDPVLHSFTVSQGEIYRGDYEITDREMKVIIRKLDGDTKEALDGAALQIRSVEGQTGAEHIVQEGISGENPEGKGTFVFHAPHPGTYRIYETMAPDGYERTESYCEFTIKEDGGTEGSLTVYNFKRKKTLGQIRAVYQPKNRFGNFTYGSGSGSGSIRTGDTMAYREWMVLSLLFFAGMFLTLPEREGKRKGRFGTMKMLAVIGVLTGACLLFSVSAHAETVCEGNTENISQTILYEAVEKREILPETARISVKNPQTGKTEERIFPEIRREYGNERWQEDFELELSVLGENVQGYVLGEEVIWDGEPEGFLSRGGQLLKAAGLSEADYEIQGIRREDTSSGDENRKLTAYGKRKVWDCRVEYGGLVHAGQNGAAVKNQGQNLAENSVITEGIRAGKSIFLMDLLLLGAVALFLRLCARRFFLKKQPCRRYFVPILFLVVSVVCLFQFLSVSKLYHQARRDYEILRNNAFAEKDGDLNIVLADGNSISQKGEQNGGVPDEEMLRMMNPEYSFWLHIPETEMDYPVVRGKDTSFYLNHSFEGKDSVSGVIFTDPFTEPFASGHTVLYGHNMKDGSMFGGLKAYMDSEFFRKSPCIRIFRQGKWIVCPIFSCHVVQENDHSPYQAGMTKTEREAYFTAMSQQSLYDTGIKKYENEDFLTLSTCHGWGKRLVLHAIIPHEESEKGRESIKIADFSVKKSQK